MAYNVTFANEDLTKYCKVLNVKRDIMGYVILLIQSIMFYITDNNIVLYAIEFALLVILPFLFIDVVKPVMKKMKGKLVGI